MSVTEDATETSAVQESESKHSVRLRVLYIVGAGRSGSTVLDTVLGHHSDVIGVGELANLHCLGWLTGDVCACGQRSQECEFWSRVRDEWQRLVPEATVEKYIRLQEKFERVRWLSLRRWARFWIERFWPSLDGRAYLRQTEALFQAIAFVSGRATIVDSSKSPMRAAWLSRIASLDVRLLHLIRDARAVVWSRAKTYKVDVNSGITRDFRRKPTVIAVGYWLWINLVTLCVRHQTAAAALELKYEDFVSHPAKALDRISDWSGLDFSATSRALLEGAAIQPEHTIAGNRVRMSGSMKLKPDWEWTEKLPQRDRRVCWLLAGWMQKRFGYSRETTVLALETHAEPAWLACRSQP